jgi:type II secretory pathway pseudopilin PulG
MTRGRKILIAIIVVVVALVVLPVAFLAVIFVPNIEKYQARAELAKAKAEIRMFRMVLTGYALDHDGQYPEHLQQLETEYVSQVDNDPWGNPYVYFLPGTKDPDECVVISYGPDRVSGTTDDLDSRTVDAEPVR